MRLLQALFLAVIAGICAASGCGGHEFGATPTSGSVEGGTGSTDDGGVSDGGQMTGTPPGPDCVPARACANDANASAGAQKIQCGTVPDGCGDSLQCGACASGQTCQTGRCLKQAYCGNDVCDAGETCDSCPNDCGCANARKCIEGACCVPSCNGRQCGDDGCGGVCGDPNGCPAGNICNMGVCEAKASCGNGKCEPMLMEDCNSCPLDCLGECAGKGGKCYNSTCCVPSCNGKACGPDGCGGTCGTCAAYTHCTAAGTCADDLICGRNGCQTGEDCNNCSADCGCTSGQKCTPAGKCCSPQCNGKMCGDDGCGGLCGMCGTGQLCSAGQCIAQVACGINGCQPGENCANCPRDCSCDPTAQVCDASGKCCDKQCAGKQCGSDGCGGVCGLCSNGQSCNASGQCVSSASCGDGKCQSGENCQSCPKDCVCNGVCQTDGTCCISNCNGATCGLDNCGKSCGTCTMGYACNGGRCVSQCGDKICVTGVEDCNNCQPDCTCPSGSSCYASIGCCRSPVCGVDWQCGSGTVCGKMVSCGGCATGTCDLTTHTCSNVCGVSPAAFAVPLPNFIGGSSFSGSGSFGNGGTSTTLISGTGGNFGGDIIGPGGTACIQ